MPTNPPIFCRTIALAASVLFTALAASAAEDRRERVLKDRTDVQARGDWVYNDLPQGIAEATRTGKPLLVVFRCIP
jgi:hypothetical protein